jgi:hypothetical protein
MRRRQEGQRGESAGVLRGQTQSDCAAMGVAEDNGLVELERVKEAGDDARCGFEIRSDVIAALRQACAGKVESNDVVADLHLLHERHKGGCGTHESVQQDERRSSPHRIPEFEVREAQAIDMKMTAFWHCRSFFSVGIVGTVDDWRQAVNKINLT